MPRASDTTATAVTNGVFNSVRSASFTFLTDASGHQCWDTISPVGHAIAVARRRSYRSLTTWDSVPIATFVCMGQTRTAAIFFCTGLAVAGCQKTPERAGSPGRAAEFGRTVEGLLLDTTLFELRGTLMRKVIN